MRAAEILGRFADLGASVRIDGGRVVLTAGKAAIPAELVAAARQQKVALLHLLAPPADNAHRKIKQCVLLGVLGDKSRQRLGADDR